MAQLVIILFLAWGSAQAGQVDWGYLSSKLEEDMTEQQVIDAIGYRPNKVEQDTCGQGSQRGPWTCKSYIFGDPSYFLGVLFHRGQDGRWRVNGWRVFP
jgi:hypothetical protein